MPANLVLDLDSTDDPVHGAQEGSPNITRCSSSSDTDQPITAMLRPGTVHANHGVVAIVWAVRRRLAKLVIGSAC